MGLFRSHSKLFGGEPSLFWVILWCFGANWGCSVSNSASFDADLRFLPANRGPLETKRSSLCKALLWGQFGALLGRTGTRLASPPFPPRRRFGAAPKGGAAAGAGPMGRKAEGPMAAARLICCLQAGAALRPRAPSRRPRSPLTVRSPRGAVLEPRRAAPKMAAAAALRGDAGERAGSAQICV